MTTISGPAPTKSDLPFNWKGLIGPCIGGAVVLIFVLSRVLSTPSTDDIATVAAQAAANQLVPTTAAPVTTEAPMPPGYDYLWCTHVGPNDPVPCAPIFDSPPTDGAIAFITLQKDPIVPGELNTANTRTILGQLRSKYPTAKGCDLWLGLEWDGSVNRILTLYPDQSQAPAGSVKLLDCSPTGKATHGTLPTAGVS